MPILAHHPASRRDFLRTTVLGGAAWIFAGCRTATPGSGGPRELNLALLSDTHIPANAGETYRGFNPCDNLRSAVPALLATRPDGAILCGDAARLEGKLEDYHQLRMLLEPLTATVPAYIGLGNHDDRANFLKVFSPPAGTCAAVDGKHVTVIEHPAIRMIVLDSLLYVNKVAGLLGRAQRTWLSRFLPTMGDRPAALFVHHTLGDNDGDLLDAGTLFDLVRPHRQVKAIFYGHSHVWEIGQRDRVRLINLPALGYNFRDQEPVGWVEARFRAEGVSLTLHALGGNRANDGRAFAVHWI